MQLKYSLFLALILLGLACKSDPKTDASALTYGVIQGKTMGTTYTVKYLDTLNRNFQPEIDQLLVEVNDEVSTYEPASFISRFNKSESKLQYFNTSDAKAKMPLHFKANYDKAQEVYENSEGAFDPTIMPIVNYWGFGYTEKRAVEAADKQKIDSLMRFVGLEKLNQRKAEDGWIYLEKANPGVQLDFSAIAKGYGVDAVADFLKSKNVENYYVEIGGELVVKGKNPTNNWWTIGINIPATDAGLQDIQSKVELQNQAVATSGNYRNYYEVNGVKYAHTINPKTGFPEKNTLLSATIFAKDCMTADAYATASMTMGLEKALQMIEQLPALDAYFLYSDEQGTIQAKSTNENLKISKSFN